MTLLASTDKKNTILSAPDGFDHPVIVTGTPRSGKTMTADILEQSGEFKSLDEPIMIWNIGFGRRDDDSRSAEEATAKLCDAIRSACQHEIAGMDGKRYMEHLAYHCLRIPFTHRVMPEALIIHVIRDAREALPEMVYGWTYRDTLSKAIRRRSHSIRLSSLPWLAIRFARNYFSSLLRGQRMSWGPRVPGLKDVTASASPAMLAAMQWRYMNEIAIRDLKQIPATQVLQVRHEQLIQDPDREVQRIARFAHVNNVEKMMSYARRYLDPDHQYSKTVPLSEADWQTVAPVINPLQVKLGYPTVGQGHPHQESNS
ncbi:MAG: sulfotransferase [Phycisphaeraceae bacterium]|nr:sulfotransferase [Phycisphaeraceae bacterium]